MNDVKPPADPASMRPLFITASTVTTGLGAGLDAQYEALQAGRSALRACDYPHADSLSGYIAAVDGLDGVQLPRHLTSYDCRNNRLALLSMNQDGMLDAIASARSRYGADRIGVFMGTSTAGMETAELAYINAGEDQPLPDYDYAFTHNNFSLPQFVQQLCKLTGPACTIATACSSSAKVFAQAHRYIESGICDAALVGGVDSLCLTTLYGFNSLQLLAPNPCRPLDVDRNGISIGEAGGFALLEKSRPQTTVPILKGFGESSDGHHISSPHPDGLGARLAMQQAVARAGIQARQIDYVHMHGTGTVANDLVETKAITADFGGSVTCSSTKGWTGHTLGAAGIVGTMFSALSLQHGFVPATLNTQTRDPELPGNLIMQSQQQQLSHVLINTFGFGGSNCSLVLGFG